MAAQLDTLDVVVLALLFAGTVAYFTKGSLWAKEKDPTTDPAFSRLNGMGKAGGKTRNIIEKLEESDKNFVIFYGSQTGTAEDYASRLAKEGHARFGLKTMVADIEDYDYDNLDTFPEDKVAVFVLATYGEGEPTDNAVEFFEFLTNEDASFSGGASAEDKPLSNLKYVAFGLGNNTYEHYNAMVRRIDASLTRLGAKRIGTAGEGDDGAGTMEEDFIAWKEPMWLALAAEMDLEEREAVYEPVLKVIEREDLDVDNETVYLGEPNRSHLERGSKGPYNAHNPYIASIKTSRELFTVKGRNCLHMDIDLTGSNLTYTTGDHIAVWPSNAGVEVARFLRVFGLISKRDTVIDIKPIDSTAKVPFPSPTTYDAAVRFQMEICAPVSRQFVASLAAFAPSEAAKAEVSKLGGDKDEFLERISSRYLNIAQVLEMVAPGEVWAAVPFSFLVEGINKIQPRYYSISSSSQVYPKLVSVTAVVESVKVPGSAHVLKGVATNYLLALKQRQNNEEDVDPYAATYAINGPREKYDGTQLPVHVRHSNFKLPSDPAKPIIMVGPGTGVAPFRGFVQERAALAAKGEKVGRALLFFGCRKRNEDFLYEDEWKQYADIMNGAFSLITAFSREGAKKVYVQHRLEEHAKEINELLQQGAYFYVCGDAANMAREVNTVLGKIVAQQRGLTAAQGEDIVKRMRSNNLYQEDVWS